MTPVEWSIIALSLRIALVATCVGLPLALWVAYVLARKEFSGKQLLNTLVLLPLVLPPVAIGYLLLVIFAPNGIAGRALENLFGFSFSFHWTGAALAAAIMAFPLMVRTIRISLESVDTGLESAASTLGASPIAVFKDITLPLIAPGIVAGAILAFAKAMGEFGATITFVASIPGQTRTIPSAIYTQLQVPGGEAAALRLVIVSIVIAMGAVLVSEIWARKAKAQRVQP